MSIGTHLQRLLTEKAMSALQLARLANVKPSFVYDIIRGKSAHPSVIKLSRIANVLGVEVSQLVSGQTGAPAPLHHSARGAGENGIFWYGSPEEETRDYIAIENIQETPREDTGTPYYFHREWIRNRLGTSPAELRMIFVRGDSMEPTLYSGDAILLDTSKTIPTPPGIFVLHDGMGLIAKRLQLIAGAEEPVIRVISDNPQYRAYERSPDELRIIGRVVWFARIL